MKKILVAMLLLITACWADSGARSADIARLQSASTILSQIMEAPDKAIPDSIMNGAKCIAVVPSMLKASFIFGANYGKGVATCRTEKGWSAPVFFRVEGGSFGFQAGGAASDLVLIIRTDEGMQHLLQSKFKLGADASAAAGPVGRDAQAATDLSLRAQILTYSRSRGAFLGVAVNGALVRQAQGDTEAFYGKDWLFYSILNGQVPAPPDAATFLKTVEQYAPTPPRLAKSTVSAVPTPSMTPDATPAAAPATNAPAEPSTSKPATEAQPAPAAPTATTPAPSATAPAPTSSTNPTSTDQP